MKTRNEIKKNLIKGAITTAAAGLLALGLGASSASAKTQGCKYYNSGRITCTYGNGNGGTTWNSSNPNTGYQSNGFRQNNGGSSYGSYNYSTPSRSGFRSWNRWG